MKIEYNTTNPEEERPDSFPQRMRYSTLYQLFKLSTSEHRGIILLTEFRIPNIRLVIVIRISSSKSPALNSKQVRK